jgi:pyridoxine 5'-phosphate synthase PdxJ
MRDDAHDLGSTARFKRDVVRGLNNRGYEVVLAFEDDPRNVAILRGEGVPTVYVHSGYYG